ncbi:MAG: class I SAM-dependent methyltransferase [Phycisphaerales bacterium]|nr:class I SAM-dependent methyltransferase [Planctomycetota bacterium]
MPDPRSDIPVPRRSTLSADYQRDWEEYYSAVEGKPPRDTLLRALNAFEEADEKGGETVLRRAIDIGCGEGRDTREILRRNGKTRWTVVATDSSAAGLERLARSLTADEKGRAVLIQRPMEEIEPELDARPGFDLVNASFALPFCRPEAFPLLWISVQRNLRAGGRFAGQFFGDRDEWACVRPKSHFTRAQVEQLLHAMSVEHLEEVEKEGDDATGKPKYHHVFHVVARKQREKE